MKLCFVIEKWETEGDGKNFIAISEGLSKAGHKITVISDRDEISPDGFDYIRFFPIGRHNNPFSAYRTKKEVFCQLMRENDFDAVLCFGTRTSMLASTCKKAIKNPLIFCERSDPEFNPKSYVMRFVRNLLYKTADGYIFQSEKQQSYYNQKIRDKSVVISDFVIKPHTECYADCPKEKTILCYARLDVRQKNPFMLFDGFLSFAKSYPEYTLKLFGEGKDREKCLEYIKKSENEWNIKLPGEVQSPEEELKKAEIFVLTSNFEGTPNQLLPAMSMGATCICTDCGNAKSFIENGVNGVMIPKNDPKTLSEALCYFAENEDMRIKLGKEAFKINEWCVSDKIIPQWVEAIETFVARKTQ